MSFDAECRAVMARIKKDFMQVLKESILDVYTEVIRRCPVYTGRLRFSMYVSNQPSNFNPPQAPRIVRGWYPAPVIPRTLPDGDIYYLGSNVDYAQKVEYDRTYSSKAGFFRISLAHFGKYFASRSQRINKVYA